jgi:hypothetical protein
MDGSAPKKSPEETREERRRERWKALITPWIYLGSIVLSVAMIMAFIRSCSERFPQTP